MRDENESGIMRYFPSAWTYVGGEYGGKIREPV